MPKRPFHAEVKKIYKPDMDCMVRALRIVMEYNPEKRKDVVCATSSVPAVGEDSKSAVSGSGLPQEVRLAGQ